MTTAVKFKAKYGAYNPDDVAGFDDDEAERIVARGLATVEATPQQVEQIRAEQRERDAASRRQVVRLEDGRGQTVAQTPTPAPATPPADQGGGSTTHRR